MSNIYREISFGSLMREYRLKAGFTLREAAKLAEVDVGNLSKQERGELNPPRDGEAIDRMLKNYGVKEGEAGFMKGLAFQHHVALLKKQFFGDEP